MPLLTLFCDTVLQLKCDDFKRDFDKVKDLSNKPHHTLQDYIVEALLTSSKKEPAAAARCVALSSTGLWLYEELTSSQQRHSRVKEAINVLLVSLKVLVLTAVSKHLRSACFFKVGFINLT